VTVETMENEKDTSFHYFFDRADANQYVQGLPADSQTIVIRDSNLEDVFIEMTGKKVGGN
jgi:ABC-2 type transport system ATP-binding protein